MNGLRPYSTGVGLRAPHIDQWLERARQGDNDGIDWLEIHSENFFDPASREWACLEQIADAYALSFHSIGMSLGSVDPLSESNLAQLKRLVDHFNPALVSDHLSWSSVNGRYFNDLLPLPYTEEALSHFSERVDQVQQLLGRQILIENPTAYMAFAESTISEWQFLNRLVEKTGCGLLLDLNNIYVNSVNLGLQLEPYLAEINWSAVTEIHLAGFTRKQLDDGEILIDTHGSRVSDPVWDLYRRVSAHCDAAALIEWDTDIPELEVLLEEAAKARAIQPQQLETESVARGAA
ncbi:DUF692 domain-containing protein [Motiliproteus sp.]|uniref:MNIO family bufferin maturase n=1 Tax=Motiliproteus sp. TaxID=1898955 RepID=UPI003BA8BB8F